ncbi:MAG TPA: hypothetical protein V6D22_15330 [Candidatus Obscuribacterales bacterium]
MNNLFKITAMAALLSVSFALMPSSNAQSIVVGTGGCNSCASGFGTGLIGAPLTGSAFYGQPGPLGWESVWGLNWGHRVYRPSEGAFPFRTITSSAVIDQDWPVAGMPPGVMSLIRPRVGPQLSSTPVF